MRRVEADGPWSLFDPKIVPHFPDLYGDEFEQAYIEAEEAGKYVKQIKARDLYAKMMRTMAQTGNGWMTFKDAANKKSNQTAKPENVIHLSNLCTRSSRSHRMVRPAVCNLGSINVSRYVKDGEFDYDKLRSNVRLAVKQLDRVID
jgi:ribonucleoside-diphosphate reductase alpha chain